MSPSTKPKVLLPPVSPLSTVSTCTFLPCPGRFAKWQRLSRRTSVNEERQGHMSLYEHVFLARQDLSQQQVDALVEQYKGVIEANGGSVGRVENWGLKSLTYRIKKNRKAYYTLMDLTAPAAAINEMERQMGLSEDVLRFMTIKVEKHEEGASAMMQRRDDRDRERGDRGDRGPRSFGDRDRGDRGPRSFGDRDDRGPRRQRDENSQGAE